MPLFVLRKGFTAVASPDGAGQVIHLRTGDTLGVTATDMPALLQALQGGVDPNEGEGRAVRKFVDLGLLVSVAQSEVAPSQAGVAPLPEVDADPEAVPPALRRDLKVVQRGESAIHDVTNPESGKTFQLYDFELALGRMLDGTRRNAEVVGAAKLLTIPVTLESLSSFVRQLGRYGFLEEAPQPAPASSPEPAVASTGFAELEIDEAALFPRELEAPVDVPPSAPVAPRAELAWAAAVTERQVEVHVPAPVAPDRVAAEMVTEPARAALPELAGAALEPELLQPEEAAAPPPPRPAGPPEPLAGLLPEPQAAIPDPSQLPTQEVRAVPSQGAATGPRRPSEALSPAPPPAPEGAAPSRSGRPVALTVAGLLALTLGIGAYFVVRPADFAPPFPEPGAPPSQPTAVLPVEPSVPEPDRVAAAVVPEPVANVAAEAPAPAPLVAQSEPEAPAAPAPEPAAAPSAGEWAEFKIARRGRVKMAEVIAKVAGTVQWKAKPEQHVRRRQVVARLQPSEGGEAQDLTADMEGLVIPPRGGLAASAKAGEVLAAVLYFEAYFQTVVSGPVPTPAWKCEVVSQSAGARAPCKVVTATSKRGELQLTGTIEPRWFDAADDAVLRLAPP